MNETTIREEIIPELLDLLKDRDFNWGTLKEASHKTNHAYGLVRLAFKDSLDYVLEEVSAYLTRSVEAALETEDLSTLRTHEKIRRIIEVGFLTLDPHKKALHTLTKKDMFLKNFLTGICLLWETVNQIWYRAGDQATDYNYYTKRFLLSLVYGPTFLFWVEEENTLEATMTLLDKRLAQVMKIPKARARIVDTLKTIFPFKRT